MKYYVREKCYNAQVYNIHACKKKRRKNHVHIDKGCFKRNPLFLLFWTTMSEADIVEPSYQ